MTILEVTNIDEFRSALGSANGGDTIRLQDGGDYLHSNTTGDRQYNDFVTIEPETMHGARVTGYIDGSKFIRFNGVTMPSIYCSSANGCEDIEGFDLVIGIQDRDANFDLGNISINCLLLNNGRRAYFERISAHHAQEDIYKFVNCQNITLRDFIGFEVHPLATQHNDLVAIQDYISGGLPVRDILIENGFLYDDPSTTSVTGTPGFTRSAQTVFVKVFNPTNIVIRNILGASTVPRGGSIENRGGTASGCLMEHFALMNNSMYVQGPGTHPDTIVRDSICRTLLNEGSIPASNVIEHGGDAASLFVNTAGREPLHFMPVPGSAADQQWLRDLVTHLDNLWKGNATMPETFTYALESDATNGTTVVNADGTWTYDPNTDYVGADSWSYRKNSSLGGTGVGNMSGSVTAPAVTAPDGSFTTEANTQASGDLKTL